MLTQVTGCAGEVQGTMPLTSGQQVRDRLTTNLSKKHIRLQGQTSSTKALSPTLMSPLHSLPSHKEIQLPEQLAG